MSKFGALRIARLQFIQSLNDFASIDVFNMDKAQLSRYEFLKRRVEQCEANYKVCKLELELEIEICHLS
jgi:hypothetical protein